MRCRHAPLNGRNARAAPRIQSTLTGSAMFLVIALGESTEISVTHVERQRPREIQQDVLRFRATSVCGTSRASIESPVCRIVGGFSQAKTLTRGSAQSKHLLRPEVTRRVIAAQTRGAHVSEPSVPVPPVEILLLSLPARGGSQQGARGARASAIRHPVKPGRDGSTSRMRIALVR